MGVCHLGGHLGRTWTDPGVLEWAKDRLQVQKMIDVGCGPGGMKSVAENLGIKWQGIDGDPKLPDVSGLMRWDFTKGSPPLQDTDHWDLGWSVEFLEHVEEKYQENYMQVFDRCQYLILTAAPPGWGGHHHVNEKDQDYWINRFESRGFCFMGRSTEQMRDHSTMKIHTKGSSFMQNTGMFFVKWR